MNAADGVLAGLLRGDVASASSGIEIDGQGVAVTVTGVDRLLGAAARGYADHAARRLAREFHGDLIHLGRTMQGRGSGVMRRAITGSLLEHGERIDASSLVIDGQQVMQEWERPYMHALAAVVAGADRDVLEIGFGMGISASEIQRLGARSHTIIECHPDVQTRFDEWRRLQPGPDVRLITGTWQERMPELGSFDSIIFDAYPLDEREWDARVVEDVHFAEHFFAAAARHLRPDGVFTYYSNEADTLSRAHQRALFRHFGSVSISVVDDVDPPADCHYWQHESFAVVEATRPRA